MRKQNAGKFSSNSTFESELRTPGSVRISPKILIGEKPCQLHLHKMCSHQGCVHRSLELHVVVSLVLIVVFVFINVMDSVQEDNVYYDYEDADENPSLQTRVQQRNLKCLKNFIVLIYLIFLLLLSFFTRIFDKSYIAMLWSTIGYSMLLILGLVILWPILENKDDNFGYVAVARPTAWVTCAFVGLAHLMNLIFFTRKLKLELENHEETTSILTNKTV